MKPEARNAQQPERDISRINLSIATTTDEKAYARYEQIETQLERYSELQPEDLYRLTLEKSAYYLNYSDAKDHPVALAANLIDTFREGTERIIRTKGYNEQIHGGMRSDLFQGFITQLQVYQTYHAQELRSSQAQKRPLRRLQRFITGR